MTQQVDLAGVHVGDELAQRLELIDRLGLDRLRVDDRPADVAERLVHRVRERVDGRRLAVAGDDEAASAVRLQILGDGRRSNCVARRSRTRVRLTPRPPRRQPTHRAPRAIARASASISLGLSGSR